MHGTSAPCGAPPEQAELFHNFLFVFLHHTQFELCPRLNISWIQSFSLREVSLVVLSVLECRLYEFFVGLFVAMRSLCVLLLAVEHAIYLEVCPPLCFEASIIVTTQINKFLYAAMEAKMAA